MQKKINIIVFSVLSLLLVSQVFLLTFDIRDDLIEFMEKYAMHRPLNHEKWHDSIPEIARFFIFLVIPLLLFYKLFAMWFAQNVKNSSLNFLRSIACVTVFMSHATIATMSFCQVPLFTDLYKKIFQSPAWGGVWVFFIIGGYLAGKSFSDGRYSFDCSGVLKYYKAKFFKIVVPTFAFIFVCCVFASPTFIKENPMALLKFFTFTYNGSPMNNAISVTWYVFTIVQLYLLAPLLSFVAIKAKKQQKNLIALSIFVFIAGLLYRFFAIKSGLNHENYVYKPFFANLDLFFGGVLLSQIVSVLPEKFMSAAFKDLSLFLLLVMLLINSFFNHMSFVYQVLFPSVYFLLVSFFLVSYSDEKWVTEYDSVFEQALAFFSSITFEFYLFHCLVLSSIYPVFLEKNALVLHLQLLLASFVITCICSVGFKRIFSGAKHTFKSKVGAKP